MKHLTEVAAVFAILVIAAACNRMPETLRGDEYAAWVSSEERAFVKVKEVNNLTIKARFLPADYLAYREYTASHMAYDSILKAYQCGLAFQVVLRADKSDKVYGNLQYFDVKAQEEYAERVAYLSFRIDEFISLQHGNNTYLPVLSHFEGFDPVGNRLTFQVVFEIAAYKCGKPKEDFGKVILTFDDPYWNIGTNNFSFSRKDLTEIPTLQL